MIKKIKYECAGIVTYNPEINRLIENINSIIDSIDIIIIVDNDSYNIDLITNYALNSKKIILIKNQKNTGIAHALNQIVRESIKRSYKWTLLLDQDSICDKNILYEYKNYLSKKNIGLLTPFIIDTNKMSIIEYNKMTLNKFSYVNYAITSGSLINNDIYTQLGGFDDYLFIDAVDIDYSKRLQINGYHQIRVNTTFLLQEVGKAETTHIYRIHKDNANKYTIQPLYRTNHSLIRQYYMARNNILLIRKYRKYNSIVKESAFVILYLISKLLVERKKILLFKTQIKGIKDGFKEKVEIYEKKDTSK